MFSSSLCASFVAPIASAATVSATPSLILKTSTPDINVGGLENLKVTTTVTNTGEGTLKLLNDPRGVLNTFPENTFNIANLAGSRPSFHGAKVNHPSSYSTKTRAHAFCLRFQTKHMPAYAASLNDPSEFTVLDPGASVNVTHDRKLDYIDQS